MYSKSLFCACLCFAAVSSFAQAQTPEKALITPQQCYEQVLMDAGSVHLTGEQFTAQKGRQPADVNELRLMLSGIPGIRVLKAGELSAYQAHQDGGIPGIGVQMQKGAVVRTGVLVTEVLSDSPALTAGIKAGDLIVQVDGLPLKGLSLLEVTGRLGGEPGSPVAVTVLRDGVTLRMGIEREVDGKVGVVVEAVDSYTAYVVSRVIEGSPAERAGIKTGDRLKDFDGNSVAELALDAHPATYIHARGLGKAVDVTVVRGGKPLAINVVCAVVPTGEARLLYSMVEDGRSTRAHLRITNLDWKETTAKVEQFLRAHPRLSKLVIDLRGAHGNNNEVVAELTALLTPTHGVSLVQGVKGKSTYINAGGATIYSGALAVLVDGNTSRAAESLARCLQERGAKVRGLETAGDTITEKIFEYALADGSTIAVAVPVGQILREDGFPLKKVQPDYTDSTPVSDVNFDDAAYQAAISDMSGGSDGASFVIMILAGVLALMIILVGGICFGIKHLVLKLIGEERLYRLSQHQNKVLLVMGLVFAAVLIAVVSLRPGTSTTGDVKVTVYLDKSPTSVVQEKVARELAAQYSGPISFEFVDMTDPGAAAQYPDVKHFPSVRVEQHRYDANGKVVASSSNGRGRTTKRELAEMIESAASAIPDGPRIPIVRAQPVK